MILELVIDIAARPDQVWPLVASTEGIPRWFAPGAKVVPGIGGSVFLSWGPEMEGEAPITGWEPDRYLAWTEAPDREISYRLTEAADGGTHFALRQTGVKDDTALRSGWLSYLALLKFDAENHLGNPAQHLVQVKIEKRDRGEWQAAILRAFAFERDGSRYSARMEDGRMCSGNVLFDRSPGYLILSAEIGALAIFLEPFGEQTAMTTSWYLKGEAVNQAREIEEAWGRTADL